MADLWDNALVNPPFRSNPPLKVNVPARTIGIVIAILAGLAALFQIFVTITAFTFANALDSFCSVYGGCETHTAILAGLGALIVLVGDVLGAWGGFQMYQMQPRGKALVVYGMVLAIAGNIVYLIGWGFGYAFGSVIVQIIIYAIVWYFVVISRFPNEAPLVAHPAGGYPGGYPQQPPYPPQQPQYPQQGYPQQPQYPPQQPPAAPPQQPPAPPQQPPAPPQQ